MRSPAKPGDGLACAGATKLLAFFVVLSLATSVAALEVPSHPQGRVSDFAGLLSPEERSRLESRLEGIEAANSNQFAVAMFSSLEGDSLEDFSIRLADAWKVGQRGRDNGILVLVFAQDRKVRVEVGKGLEGAITDALSGRIIREVLAPRFRSGDYAGGLLAAVEALDGASRGEFEALPKKRKNVSPLAGLLPLVAFVGFWIVVARLNRATQFGGRGGALGPFFWGVLGGVLGSRGGSGGGGGFSGGGFSGGGFSGGGGGFGGGGASGDW